MQKRLKVILALVTGLALAPLQSFAAAGGIALGATRVIYPEGASQTSLPVSNSTQNQRFLINSWVEDADGHKTNSFVVTPPLFVSEAKTENTLRIMYVGPQLPQNKESLFYMNVKAIPSLDKAAAAGKNILQLAVLSRIKLFVRPQGLPMQEADAPGKLTFSHAGGEIRVNNPTPYYVTLVNIKSGGKNPVSIMVAPMSSSDIAGTGSQISFQSINDYGALDKPLTRSVQ